ncbi:MAG: hypothetical protein LBH00_03830 [Planctomycetaceae bacterium]|nr:hypothetical protein [Planctomycetaceae bacterium]
MKCRLKYCLFTFITFYTAAAFPQDGDRFIADSLKMLSAVRTVECDLLIDTVANSKEYSARGSYQEQVLPNTAGNAFLRSMYRLEIYFSMALSAARDADPNRMTLVCHPSEDREKNRIERYTSVEGVKTFSTIDLGKLEEKLRNAGHTAQNNTENSMVFAQISEVRYLGGLAGMMRQIARTYEFDAPVQEILPGEEKVPVLKLTGSIRHTLHKELLPRFGGLNKKGQYPAGYPSDIEISLGRHNDFPYKIRYLRRQAEGSDKKELLLQETFSNVKVNAAPIPVSVFDPLNVPAEVFQVKDETENFLRSLGLPQ